MGHSVCLPPNKAAFFVATYVNCNRTLVNMSASILSQLRIAVLVNALLKIVFLKLIFFKIINVFGKIC